MTKIHLELTEDQLHLISEMQLHYRTYWEGRLAKAEAEPDWNDVKRYRAKVAFINRFWTTVVRQLDPKRELVK